MVAAFHFGKDNTDLVLFNVRKEANIRLIYRQNGCIGFIRLLIEWWKLYSQNGSDWLLSLKRRLDVVICIE